MNHPRPLGDRNPPNRRRFPIRDKTAITNQVVALPGGYRRAIRQSVAVVAWGKTERQGQVIHILVDRAMNLSDVVNSSPPKLQSRNFR